MPFKTGIAQADDLLREARKNTLNKRINYKGNYENYITGGSHALDNQNLWDKNEYAIAMNDPNSGWFKNEQTQELYDRYTNPQHNEIAGNAPYDSKLKYIHRYTPSTRRGRRISDIFFHKTAKTPDDLFEMQRAVNKYEGVK